MSLSLWYWDPLDNKPAHIRDRTDRFEAMRPPDPLSCNMKDLHDAMQDTLAFQRSSPAQDLTDTISVVCQVSQDGNQDSRVIPCSVGLVFACFKYSDTEPSQVSANSPGQFRSSEDILAGANDVVGGDDEECRFRAQTQVVYL